MQQIAGTPEEEQVRQIVREEIASMAGLVLRRTSEEHLTRSPDRNITDTQIRGMLAEIFGEVLSDFSRTESSPGT